MKDSLAQKLQNKYSGSKFIKFQGVNTKEDVEPKELGKLHGHWDREMIYDGEELWNAEKGPFANVLEHERRPLASDCRFREDAVMWKTKDLKKAQQMKEKLEDIQRADRKLRDKFRKARR